MIGVIGAGAFGTALAVTLARSNDAITLWGRNVAVDGNRQMPRLAGVVLPENVSVTADFGVLAAAETLLVAIPMQKLADFLAEHRAALSGRTMVACCKGIDLASGKGPTALVAEACPGSTVALLTGPSFAADLARGLPTALTLACSDEDVGAQLQARLSNRTMRLYRTTDVVGAELGGALKNVIAIAAGVAIGAGLGDSARAALMTRGYAEMVRLALALGGRAETLAGLSGFGDLVLTCTSAQSRNFRHGLALGAGEAFDPGVTVEGVATSRAVAALARSLDIDTPIATMVAAFVDGRIGLDRAIETLLSRPLKQE